jgi:hypothetical protein
LGQVRVSFQAAPGFTSVISQASIATCPIPFSMIAQATPVPLLFGGSASATIGSGVSLVSDWANLTWTAAANGLLVTAFWGTPESTATTTTGISASDQTAYCSGNQAAVIDPTASIILVSAAGVIETVVLIETQAAPGGGGGTRRSMTGVGK